MLVDCYKTRILLEANYFLDNKTTIRKTAEYFGISKSSVHVDLSKRLQFIDYSLYESVKKILDYNYSVKHLRGGLSTKEKYKKN